MLVHRHYLIQQTPCGTLRRGLKIVPADGRFAKIELISVLTTLTPPFGATQQIFLRVDMVGLGSK
jgi:hypothetical protein